MFNLINFILRLSDRSRVTFAHSKFYFILMKQPFPSFFSATLHDQDNKSSRRARARARSWFSLGSPRGNRKNSSRIHDQTQQHTLSLQTGTKRSRRGTTAAASHRFSDTNVSHYYLLPSSRCARLLFLLELSMDN